MPPTFSELGVPEPICAALSRRGITTPFEIQAATIADALAGRDVCGRAPTGSGKTLAFGIPLVATVERAVPRRPRALILAPTRELAEQIASELSSISGPVRIACVYGGVAYTGQIAALRRGVDILVACPGRLEDLISQDFVNLADVDQVVIDEADRMADMGFLPVVRRLLEQTSSNRQTVLFSATLDGDVAKLTRDHQRDPVRHDVAEETPDVSLADHVFWRAGATNRTELTVEAVNAVWPAIIFSRTRHGSDRLARSLTREGIAAVAIHGGRSQRQRNKALADFASGRAQALVATDVAARGIHVDDVASVIHFDMPEDHKDYVHRSGRTARAGRSGVILSLVQASQVKAVTRLQRLVGLNEPLVDPDPAALRALSDSPGSQQRQTAAEASAATIGTGASAGRGGASGNGSGSESNRDRGQRRDRGPRPGGDRPRGQRQNADRARSEGGEGQDRERPSGTGRPARPARSGGVNLSTRSRVGNGRGGPGGSRGDSAGSRGDSAGSASRSAAGRPGARNGSGATGGKPGEARSGERAGDNGRSGRSGAGRPAGGGGSRSGRPRSSPPDPAGNRKTRRAHLQWSGADQS